LLGRDHAIFSGLAVAAGAPLCAHLTHSSISPGVLAVGTVCAAGFGLLPDLDEPHSTVSRKMGVLSRAVSEITKKFAGGHRMATHSLIACAAVFVAMFFACRHPLGSAIVVGCAAAVSLKLLVPKGMRYMWGLGLVFPAAIAYGVYAAHYAGVWLAASAAVGYLFHLFGDALTIEGVPFLFPVTRRKMAIPLLGHTDSAREHVLGILLWIGLTASLVIFAIMPAYRQHII